MKMEMPNELVVLRRSVPALRRTIHGSAVTYLDNAAMSLVPTPVLDAMMGYYENQSANIHRGRHALSEEASEAYESARADVAVAAAPEVRVDQLVRVLDIIAKSLGPEMVSSLALLPNH
jgi:cysteine desulfurase/selenocysteine lyase